MQSYVNEEEQAVARRAQIDGQIEPLLPDWQLAPVVHDLTALRGVDVVIAAAVMAEVGDFARFASARQLMSYLGLVPSEHSSAGAARVHGPAGPGRDYWIKEIRNREVELVAQAEAAYAAMVKAWTDRPEKPRKG